MKQQNLKGKLACNPSMWRVKMDHGCTKCETTIFWSNSLRKCLQCGNRDYKYKEEEQDCSLRVHEESLSKVTEELLRQEDRKILEKIRTHCQGIWDWKHSYGCPTCKSPFFWSVLEDKCLKCGGNDYIDGTIFNRVHSTRYNCRNSHFISRGRDQIRICRAMHTKP